MIPLLRSIDGFLNRFDELSHRHADLISNFQTNFSDIENPLRSVTRDEEEQRRTAENLLVANLENGDQMRSFGTVEDFNRRVIKSRSNNRPPSYSSNDTSSYFNRVPSRSSWVTTESMLPQRAPILTIGPAISKSSATQSVVSTSIDTFIEHKYRVTTKTKPKVIPQNPPPARRYARGTITTFTMETANRLSKPRTYYQSSDQKGPFKRSHRRTKVDQNAKKDTPNSSITSILAPSSPQTKRTKATIAKSSSKKLRADNRIAPDNTTEIPMSNYPRPAVYFAPPPKISLTFPMQRDLQSSRIVVLPKKTVASKTVNVFTNKKSTAPSNRMVYLLA